MSAHLKFITTHPPFRVNNYTRLDLIRKELRSIVKCEESLHEMDYDPHLVSAVEEALEALDEFLDYDPTPSYGGGEPPMTMAEMHAGAWKQHLEFHS